MLYSIGLQAFGPAIPTVVGEATFLQVLWFALIGVLLIGYFVLDGFDLGSGALYPFIAKTDHDKALVRRSIGPLWDGNEVWLLTAGGALFAAFGPAYATGFSGFYLAIMLVLFSLIARAIAIEFRSVGKEFPGVFDAAFFLGSALPALLFGVAVGNVLNGVPLDLNGDVIQGFAVSNQVAQPLFDILNAPEGTTTEAAGAVLNADPAALGLALPGIPLLGLLRPFPIVCGLVSLSAMLLQGACWQSQKQAIHSPVRARAMKLRAPLAIAVIASFVVASVLFIFFTPVGTQVLFGIGVDQFNATPEAVGNVGLMALLGTSLFDLQHIIAYIGALLIIVAALAVIFLKKNDLFAFIAASAVPVGLIILVMASAFPFLVPSIGPGPSITILSPENIGIGASGQVLSDLVAANPEILPGPDGAAGLTLVDAARLAIFSGAGGTDVALGAMAIISSVGVPLVLIYHVIIYRTFRGRIHDEDIKG